MVIGKKSYRTCAVGSIRKSSLRARRAHAWRGTWTSPHRSVVSSGSALSGASMPALSCSDEQPPGSPYPCSQQARWGKCGEHWMQGSCCRSCFKCDASLSASCAPDPPPSPPVTPPAPLVPGALSLADARAEASCFDVWAKEYPDEVYLIGGRSCYQRAAAKTGGGCPSSIVEVCAKTCGLCSERLGITLAAAVEARRAHTAEHEALPLAAHHGALWVGTRAFHIKGCKYVAGTANLTPA